MGMCKPSGGINTEFGPYRHNIKNTQGDPNSRTNYYDENSKKLLQ